MSKELLGSLELNRLYQMDCLEGMRLLPEKSIDLICIDPPYNIGKDKRWDKYKDNDYIEFMTNVFKECERVLKDNGSFYWFHNDMEQTRKLMDALDSDTYFIQKNFIVWNKRYNGSPRKYYFDNVIKTESSRKFRPLTEYCLFYTFQDETGLKGIQDDRDLFKPLRDYFWSERLKVDHLSYKEINEKIGFASNGGGVASGVLNTKKLGWRFPKKETYEKFKTLGICERSYEDLRKEYEELRYTFNHQGTHHDVWDYEVAKKLGHVTPKPLPLIENIIRHSSNEGDIVLDCFGGSGTTFVAAEKLNRKWIGFEREPEYIEIANKRLEAVNNAELR